MATDDLFGSDSDSGNDTDDLIASAQKQEPQPKSAKKRLGAAAKKSAPKRLQKSAPPKKKKIDIPDADNLFDDSDDSDDSEEEDGPSKKDRMEALIRARRENSGLSSAKKSTSAAKLKANKKDSTSGTAQTGYDSETSIRSADYVRTKEDDDFIDADDDDPDARRELYAEQHFDDEEAEEVDDYGSKGKRKRKYQYDDDVDLRRSKKNEEDADNPIMMAVSKMKKNKKTAKKLSDLEEEAKEFVFQMVVAANEDEEDLKAKRPAMRKLSMLPSVVEISGRRDMMRPLLDNQFLTACGQWIQPLPNGMLGNVTLRSELLRSVSKMTGETGVSTDDLKRSGFGKKVMALYMHPNETPDMKRFLKQLIEQWSRPVFQKNGNMKDLENVQRERQVVSSMARTNALKMTAATSSERATMNDFSTIIAKGQVRARELGNNRVRVPFSKGFEFSVRPEAKAPTDESKKLHSAKAVAESREALNKRLLENKRVKKNYRSANISIEGRATK